MFKREPSLRDKCIEAYGKEFGEAYDALNSGKPIGGFGSTSVVISMIDAVKAGKPFDKNNMPELPPIEIMGAYIPGQGTYKNINGEMVLVKPDKN